MRGRTVLNKGGIHSNSSHTAPPKGMVQTRLDLERDGAVLGTVFDDDVLEVILCHLPLHDGIRLLKTSKQLYYGNSLGGPHLNIGAKWIVHMNNTHHGEVCQAWMDALYQASCKNAAVMDHLATVMRMYTPAEVVLLATRASEEMLLTTRDSEAAGEECKHLATATRHNIIFKRACAAWHNCSLSNCARHEWL